MTEHWDYEQRRDGTVVLRAPIEGSEALFTFAVIDTGTPGKSLARAQQIVTAVNCHEELVQACRVLAGNFTVDPQWKLDNKSMRINVTFGQLRRARAALARAEGREKEPTR